MSDLSYKRTVCGNKKPLHYVVDWNHWELVIACLSI